MMMQVLDDEPILVLHPGKGKGYRVRISGLADNFQLVGVQGPMLPLRLGLGRTVA